MNLGQGRGRANLWPQAARRREVTTCQYCLTAEATLATVTRKLCELE